MNFALFLDAVLIVALGLTVFLLCAKSAQLWLPEKTGLLGLEKVRQLDDVAFFAYRTRLQKGLTLLSVIVSTTPFIGLIGTVLHIIEALQKITTTVDTSLIGGPISTALYATLLGLCSAVPASAGLAFFNKKIEEIEDDYAFHQEK